MRWLCIMLIVLYAPGLMADEFGGFNPPVRDVQLFEVSDEPEAEGDRLEEYSAASQWRPVSLEAHVGLIGSKRTMWSGAMGTAIPLYSSISLALRAEYNMELGASRDYRPQTRGFLFEPGVRLHLDFHEHVALYSQHALSVVYRLDYYKLDPRRAGDDRGVVSSFGAGTANSVGLEFGERTWRGYVETGLRTQFIIFQTSDEDAKGFEDDIREDFRFQWLVIRAGVRFYF
jgi:hypothetical protein